MRLLRRIVLLLISCLILSAPSPAGEIHHITIEGVINPIKARYVSRTIGEAQEGADLVVISINTPGGLVDSMDGIVSSIVNSSIPVVTFVEPRTARAASAGAFIVMAGDVAVMAPSTRIGSAHPVGGQGEDIEGAMEEKVMNDLTSLARSLAERRGRNVDFAVGAVTESMNLTAEEALDTGAIDMIAEDMDDLIRRLDGYVIEHEDRHDTLVTSGAVVVEMPMSGTEKFLDAIANPTVAYLLLTLGMLGLIYEFSSPGLGFGGIVGTISLLLALLSLAGLPIHYGGILLLIAGIIMLLLEIKIPSHGLLTVGGIAALILGGMIFVDSTEYYGAVQRIRFGIVIPVMGVLIGFFVLCVYLVAKALRSRVRTGEDGLVGSEGTAKTDLDPLGSVFVDGARWNAGSESGRIEEGETIVVTAVARNPSRLTVRRKE